MQKLYSRINWENKPSIETPLNEQNLNKMDAALDGVDNRIISQDTTKADKTELNDLVMNWVIDERTGVITITKKSGEKILFDLNIEKIPVSFSLSDNGILTMTTDDGTRFTANIGAMIPVLTFNDSDTIAISVDGVGVNKTYSLSIKNSSITEEKMQPNYLADIKAESAKAEASKNEAAESAKQSQSYAVGTGNVRPNEAADNAKAYYEKSKEIYDNFNSSGNVTGVKGNIENAYRTGNVNLTPENIGALPKNGTAAKSKSAIGIQSFRDESTEYEQGQYNIRSLRHGEKSRFDLLCYNGNNDDTHYSVACDDSYSVIDAHNGTETKLNYGAPHIADFSWVGVWNGYELRAGAPSDVVKNGNGLTKNVGEINAGVNNVNIKWFTIVVHPSSQATGIDYDFGGKMASVICCVNGDTNAWGGYFSGWYNVSRTKVHFTFGTSPVGSIRITGLLLCTT